MKNSAVQEIASWGNQITNQLMQEWKSDMQLKGDKILHYGENLK